MSSDKPRVLAYVVMGVCGCGKSTIGKALAEKLGCEFIDGDDWHPQSNKELMTRGIPLTDEDRWPWLDVLHRKLAGWVHGGTKGVLACSALRRIYRDILIGRGFEGEDQESKSDIASQTLFVLLHGSQELLEARVRERTHSFMPPGLLQSQLDTLELPSADEKCVQCDISDSVENIVQSVLSCH